MANFSPQKQYNRIKVVLVEKGKTNRWLAEKIGKGENTISRWCSNRIQPSLEQLDVIARVLNVDISALLLPTDLEQ
ncbi:helix-turn-helix transcriptional regulator [Candidatus Bacteroides intestinigallinarum]|jgi:putative transcriptional regulator|uniref:helix-turn-helix transcriptional regulator n=1 Tax=Candidatus Bacteroides intestinigallinarum TaxID=2838470 RepID=UPI0022E74CF3|nr:helix-turn-helix transcriptional regulator [Candidatus Bacteroides intestinigallinarum]